MRKFIGTTLRASQAVQPWEVLPGTRVAIDMNLYSYQLARQSDATLMATPSEQADCILREMARMLDWFEEYKCTPVFVCDGMKKPLKATILQARQEQRDQAKRDSASHSASLVSKKRDLDVKTKAISSVDAHVKKAYDSMVKTQENNTVDDTARDASVKTFLSAISKHEKKSKDKESKAAIRKIRKGVQSVSKLTKKVHDSKRKMFGLPREFWLEADKLLYHRNLVVIAAPSDAEAQCAALAANGSVNFVISEDFDTLAYGSPALVSNLIPAMGQDTLELTFLNDVLHRLGITYQQFVELCLFCGSDYFQIIDDMEHAESKSKKKTAKRVSVWSSYKYLCSYLRSGPEERANLADATRNTQLRSIMTLSDSSLFSAAKQHFLEPQVHDATLLPNAYFCPRLNYLRPENANCPS